MATLAELYEFLETKQDDSHLDSRFSYDAFLPVEQPKARLEILTWWKIERLIEDENCNFDKNFIVSYFDERVKATNYGAQNEAYMSRSAEKWVRGLCFNELGVGG